ncbi:hypothetical protein SDRG_16289 [Saprolegnia diclina VS20]|uniref:Uncharacterized protein n=1 Tax=Saprolegnia diclina (strain VS20) TaxID=1156394 RepID=T0PXS5_SAPDV|nr:hypothetical protein SDRG_16289 [Saprolegnia diclina VS20]EQC25840.1 hypothetical protein SDRG_16289 [Saprolegnia diclina VS20]|eukprot:XP_008620715.1 hypothetical protein SDRG_16289 [Saprolegnia diclina VS20]
MTATFQRVVLAQPEIASMIFEFQFGLYEDVRPAFRACKELIAYGVKRYMYESDVSFFATFAPHAAWPRTSNVFGAPRYCLHPRQRDERLPLHMAVAGGCVELTKRMLRCRPDLASEDMIVLAFHKDRLDLVEVLLSLRATVPELQARGLMNETDGRPEYSCYLTRILARDDSKRLILAERFGLRPDEYTAYSRREAFLHATLENATLALQLFPWLCYSGILDDVAGKGFLPLVISLHERELNCSTKAMDTAAANGHLEVVRFLHEHRREGCTTRAMDEAATNGNLEVVRFLHASRTEGCTIEALDGAARNGLLAIVRFLIEHRAEGASPHILDAAAAKGHYGVVQYLHSLGSFDATVAAVDDAARFGHREVVEFLLTNRREGCTHDTVVQNALENGHLRTAAYLLSLKYRFPTGRMNWNADSFHKPEIVGVLQMYMDHGGPWDDNWMSFACEASNLPLVQLLHKNATARCRPNALKTAINNKAWVVVYFLLANGAADVTLDVLRALLCMERFDDVTHLLQFSPKQREFAQLLLWAARTHRTEATRHLLALGIGEPRGCLVEIAGCKQHVTESTLALPYCMDATDHLGNVIYLLRLYKVPCRRRATVLRLITQELTHQGSKASQTIDMPPCVAARATALLALGAVVDWALALVICHLHATHAATTTSQLRKEAALVQDLDLKIQLTRLIRSKQITS